MNNSVSHMCDGGRQVSRNRKFVKHKLTRQRLGLKCEIYDFVNLKKS